MKKRFLLLALTILMVVTLCACGGNADPASSSTPGTPGESSGSNTAANGYVLEVDGSNGKVTLAADMDFSTVADALGEPVNYFEAPSCAFQGIDKIYTYSHFEVHTYPDGSADRISMILLLDDLISTPEGISIGATQADMEAAYGTGYTASSGAYTYAKDNMRLTFLITDGSISSIEYDSLALDAAN